MIWVKVRRLLFLAGRHPSISLTATRDDSQHLVQRHLSANDDRTGKLPKSFVSKLRMSRAQKDLISGQGSTLPRWLSCDQYVR